MIIKSHKKYYKKTQPNRSRKAFLMYQQGTTTITTLLGDNMSGLSSLLLAPPTYGTCSCLLKQINLQQKFGTITVICKDIEGTFSNKGQSWIYLSSLFSPQHLEPSAVYATHFPADWRMCLRRPSPDFHSPSTSAHSLVTHRLVLTLCLNRDAHVYYNGSHSFTFESVSLLS